MIENRSFKIFQILIFYKAGPFLDHNDIQWSLVWKLNWT